MWTLVRNLVLTLTCCDLREAIGLAPMSPRQIIGRLVMGRDADKKLQKSAPL